MRKALALSLIIGFIMMIACNWNINYKLDSGSVTKASPSKQDSFLNDAPIKDPNNPKPMALAMRAMVASADSIKSMILKGESPDSNDFPFIRFFLAEPTDPQVLEPRFFENARLFQQSYKSLFRQKGNEAVYYNAMIGMCINCHQYYCNGPLRRIRKLRIL